MRNFGALATLIDNGFEGYVNETWAVGKSFSQKAGTDVYFLTKKVEPDHAGCMVHYSFEDNLTRH